MSLKQELQKAFPQLTENHFGRHESDLYVVKVSGLLEWLETEHPLFFKNVTEFVSPHGSRWAGEGRVCLDIPFAEFDEYVKGKTR